MTKPENAWCMTRDLWDSLVAGNVIGVIDTTKSPKKIYHITVLHKKDGLLTLSHPFEYGALASAAGAFKFDNHVINHESGEIFKPLTREIVSFAPQAGKEASAEYLKRKKSARVIDEEELYSLIETVSDQGKAIQQILTDNTMPKIYEKASAILSIVLGEEKCTKEQIAALCWLLSHYEYKIQKLREQAMPMGMHPADILVLAME